MDEWAKMFDVGKMKSEENKKRAENGVERQQGSSAIEDPEHVRNIFQNDELACRWIWLGKLLCDLDDCYDGVNGIFLRADYGVKYQPQRMAVSKWMEDLQRLLTDYTPEANAIRSWLHQQHATHLLTFHRICAVAVVMFRQFFQTRIYDNPPMTISRIVTIHRGLDEIIRAYQAIKMMEKEGKVIKLSDEQQLILTPAFTDFIFAPLAEKKRINTKRQTGTKKNQQAFNNYLHRIAYGRYIHKLN